MLNPTEGNEVTIVTLSRQLGSGGDRIAAQVAEALNLRVIDKTTIYHAAYEAGVPKMALQEMGYEGRRSLAERILDMVKATPAMTVGPGVVHPRTATPIPVSFGSVLSPTMTPMSMAMEEYVRIVNMVVRDLAREGNVLIVGQGGQVLLRDEPGALHVQIVASLDQRVERVMTREGLGRQAAVRRVRDSDQARTDYLRRYHGINWLDPHLYDLTLNTDRISMESAVELIVRASQVVRHE